MNKTKKIIVFMLMLLVAFSAFAYQLSPLSVTYDPRGAGSAKVYTVTNDSDSPIAITFKPFKRMVTSDGEEVLENANAYFSISPSKTIIKPQSTQLVRVQYRGPQTVTKEMNFRIQAEQIDYSLGASEEKAGQTISFLFVYSTSAYVKPSKVIEKVSTAARVNGDKLEVLIENRGSVHQILTDLSVEVRGNNGAVYQIPEEALSKFSGANLLTNSKFLISVDMPDELKDATDLSANAIYDYKYTE